MAELLRIFNRVIFFEEVAICRMINTVAQDCWVAISPFYVPQRAEHGRKG